MRGDAAAQGRIGKRQVAQGTALQEIAIVEQQVVRRAFAGPRDQRRRARQPQPGRGAVGEIIIAKDVHVQVRRRHDPQIDPLRRMRRVG